MKKRRIAGLLVSMTAAVVLLTSCGNSKIPLSFDDQIKEDGTFNQSLFYRNDLVTPVPDPEVTKSLTPAARNTAGIICTAPTAPPASSATAARI